MYDLDDSIFELTREGGAVTQSFQLSGETVNDLADELIKAIREALSIDDFSRILSPERDFKM